MDYLGVLNSDGWIIGVPEWKQRWVAYWVF